MDEALRLLPRQAWTIHHAPDWPQDEIQMLSHRLAEQLGQPLEWRADGSIAAGFRITAGGAGLDATLEGLLADREPLQARLLALMGTEREL
jgi:hypothetical protein